MNSTRSLAVAEFVLGLSWTTLPPDIQRQALRCVLDLCGCGLAGSRTRVAAILRTYVRETYGPGGCHRDWLARARIIMRRYAGECLRSIRLGSRRRRSVDEGTSGGRHLPRRPRCSSRSRAVRSRVPHGGGGGVRGSNARWTNPPSPLPLLPWDGGLGADRC